MKNPVIKEEPVSKEMPGKEYKKAFGKKKPVKKGK